jgi:hypothetical protein
MFPMRDHHYELAKARQIELLEVARQDQELRMIKNHDYPVWSFESFRRMWNTIRMNRGEAQSHTQRLSQMNIVEG